MNEGQKKRGNPNFGLGLKEKVETLEAEVEELKKQRVDSFIPYPCPKCVREDVYQVIAWDHVGVMSMSNQWWYKIEGECPRCETLYLLDVPHLNQRGRDYERGNSGIKLPGGD